MNATLSPHTVLEPDTWPSRRFHAMGCTMTVQVAASDDLADVALDAAIAHIQTAEHSWSRFDPTSELSRLNAHSGRWVTVSPTLWGPLSEALTQSAATNGLYDPTILYAIQAAGYERSFDDLAAEVGPVAKTHAQPGQWRALKLAEAKCQIKLPPNVGIDLGGIGKGLVAAQVIELLRPFGPTLVDAGGDVAAGTAAPGYPGWPVAIAAPASGNADSEDQDLLWVWLREATLATSGVDYRRWLQDGAPRHHILDPRTGEPAQTDLVTVSVLDPSAARAEAWAKAALVLGAEAAYVALTRRGLAALLVEQDGRVWMTPALRPWVAWRGPRVPE